MKVCMVGNSHLAAIKLALDQGALEGQGIKLEFFGASGRSFKKLRFEDGVICGPPDIEDQLLLVSGGKYTRLDPVNFDAIVVYGGSLYLGEFVESVYGAVVRRGTYLSSEFLDQGIADWLDSQLAVQIASLVRKTGVRTLLLPRPIPAARPSAPTGGAATSDAENPALLRESILLRVQQVARSKDLHLVLQPTSTLTPDLRNTRREYSIGSKRLLDTKAVHGEEDVKHMNARFGAVVLENLARILSTSGIAAPPDDRPPLHAG